MPKYEFPNDSIMHVQSLSQEQQARAAALQAAGYLSDIGEAEELTIARAERFKEYILHGE